NFLLPFGLLEIVLAWPQKRWTTLHATLLLFAPIVLVILSDDGTANNHLIDLIVLPSLTLAALWPALAGRPRPAPLLRGLLALVLLWGLASAWTNVMGHKARDTFVAWREGGDERYTARPLAELVSDEDSLLSEDPFVPVSRRLAPVIIDPCSLAVTAKSQPR